MMTRRLVITGCCAVIAILTSVVAEKSYDRVGAEHTQGWTTWHAAPLSAVVRSLRPNYPYSVVPGGVYSPQELRSRMKSDRLVKTHYAGFNTQTAYLVTTTQDRYQYASYRKHDQIYWTDRKVRIPKGEMLITDGKNFIRTRCGNRLSDEAGTKTAAAAPLALYFPPTSFELDLPANEILTFASGPITDQPMLPLRPMLLPGLSIPNVPEDWARASYPSMGWVPGMPRSRSATRAGSTGGGPGNLPVATPIIPGSTGPVATTPIPITTPVQIGFPIIPVGPPISVITPVPEPQQLTPVGIALFGLLWSLVYKFRGNASRLVRSTGGGNQLGHSR